MEGTATLITTIAQQAQAAFANADYDTAIVKAGQVQALIMGTPNLARNLAGGGSQSISWPGGGTVEQFIALCRRLQTQARITAGGPFQTSKVVYERPTTTEGLQ